MNAFDWNAVIPKQEVSVAMVVSDDEDQRRSRDGKAIAPIFVFEGWTVQDLFNQVMNATSVRVKYQNSHRGKALPSRWVVPKVGTIQRIDDMAILARIVGAEMAAKLAKSRGSATAAVAMFRDLAEQAAAEQKNPDGTTTKTVLAEDGEEYEVTK